MATQSLQRRTVTTPALLNDFEIMSIFRLGSRVDATYVTAVYVRNKLGGDLDQN